MVQQYRKKDPGDSEEVEFMENVFDALCSLLSEESGAGKKAFVEAEGVELMIIMMKYVSLPFDVKVICKAEANVYREKLLAKTRAIKVLDYALQTEAGTTGCERFVEMLGLKTFFSAFMGKVSYLLFMTSQWHKA